MIPHEPNDFANPSMLDLFRVEAEHQTASLTSGLLELERGPATPRAYEILMRAAHSFKGAARIVNLQAAVRVAHAFEDCFVAAQQGKLLLLQPNIDVLFRGVDLLAHLAKHPDSNLNRWEAEQALEIAAFLKAVEQLLRENEKTSPKREGATQKPTASAALRPKPAASEDREAEQHDATTRAATKIEISEVPVAALQTTLRLVTQTHPSPEQALARVATPTQPEDPLQALILRKSESPERVVRLTAENLNRLLALAGESLVESRWLGPFAESFQRLKRHQAELGQELERLRQALVEEELSDRAHGHLNELLRQLVECQQFLAGRVQELDLFDRRSAHLSQRLYLEVLRTRMRPFSDGVRRFPRMVRDLARSLGKEVRLEISGEGTQVDRDVLERLETPLAHLLRNAVDHGCEPPEERTRNGKPAECLLRLEARHSAGVLLVTVADDGRGVDFDELRRALNQKRLASPTVVNKLSESELLEFLFLPGFTLKETVTEISGRGVGLDVVQNMVKGVRGGIRLTNQPGRGLRVQLQLPLTLSVLRALLVEVGGEPYAFPLSQITRTLKLPRASIQSLEGQRHFRFGDQQVGLLTAHQVFECRELEHPADELPVVVLTDRNTRYGLIVDRFLGERELVVQPLDPRLGKVREISAAALMEDGAPVLIVDVEDTVRSIEKLVGEGRLGSFREPEPQALNSRKRILAVDDSLAVRELERKLLIRRGYLAEVAVDGMDAWHALRSGGFDLVITDVDMPRLDGIELVSLIKKDPLLKSVPVLIVSYKDREEDRMRGLEAGADYYLAKGSFHDETLLQAVVDLIGAPDS